MGVAVEQRCGALSGRGVIAAPPQRRHIRKQRQLLLQQRRDLPVLLLQPLCGAGGKGQGSEVMGAEVKGQGSEVMGAQVMGVKQ